MAKGRTGISRTAVMLYGLNDDRSDCAVACLAWQHETMKWEVLDRAVLQSTVEGWVLECDAHALGEDLADQHPGQRSRLGQARTFYRDWAAATWVENVNIDKGWPSRRGRWSQRWTQTLWQAQQTAGPVAVVCSARHRASELGNADGGSAWVPTCAVPAHTKCCLWPRCGRRRVGKVVP